MNVVKYNPGFPGRHGLSALVDDFFNRNLGDFIGSDMMLSRPSVNVRELDTQFVIDLAAPGLEKENFDLKIENDHLKISANKEIKNEETGEKYTRREFNFTSFTRTFALPENVDREQINAAYDKGVLSITLPKTVNVENENVKQIKIS